jgi:hypothetical protein
VSDTDLREALHAVADAVPVPAPDRLGVERRVRAVRRRRRTTGVGVVAAAAVAALLVGVRWPRSQPARPPVAAVVADGVPVVVEGELGLVSGGRLERTGVRLDRVLGRRGADVVGIDTEGSVVVVPASGSPRVLVEGPVRDAAVSASGALAWVDATATLHLPGATRTGFRGDLLATNGDDWVERRGGRVVVERPEAGLQPVGLRGDRTVSAGFVGDDVVLGAHDGSQQRFDLRAPVPAERSAATVVAAEAYWWTDRATYAVVSDGAGRVLQVCAPECRDVYTDPTGTMTIPGQG